MDEMSEVKGTDEIQADIVYVSLTNPSTKGSSSDVSFTK